MKILIIGYGSPIRGDDAIGPLVADCLEKKRLPSEITIIARHILTAELVTELMANERAIFLDAEIDLAPGTVRCQRLIPNGHTQSSMAHSLEPQELLAWCMALYGSAPESFLVSAGGASFAYSNYTLTPIGNAAMAQMMDWVQLLLQTSIAHLPFFHNIPTDRN